jgi:hypothetical protein
MEGTTWPMDGTGQPTETLPLAEPSEAGAVEAETKSPHVINLMLLQQHHLNIMTAQRSSQDGMNQLVKQLSKVMHQNCTLHQQVLELQKAHKKLRQEHTLTLKQLQSAQEANASLEVRIKGEASKHLRPLPTEQDSTQHVANDRHLCNAKLAYSSAGPQAPSSSGLPSNIPCLMSKAALLRSQGQKTQRTQHDTVPLQNNRSPPIAIRAQPTNSAGGRDSSRRGPNTAPLHVSLADPDSPGSSGGEGRVWQQNMSQSVDVHSPFYDRHSVSTSAAVGVKRRAEARLLPRGHNMTSQSPYHANMMFPVKPAEAVYMYVPVPPPFTAPAALDIANNGGKQSDDIMLGPSLPSEGGLALIGEAIEQLECEERMQHSSASDDMQDLASLNVHPINFKGGGSSILNNHAKRYDGSTLNQGAARIYLYGGIAGDLPTRSPRCLISLSERSKAVVKSVVQCSLLHQPLPPAAVPPSSAETTLSTSSCEMDT